MERKIITVLILVVIILTGLLSIVTIRAKDYLFASTSTQNTNVTEIYTTQSATIEGKITNNNEGTLTIVNNNNLTADFSVDQERFMINKFESNSANAINSNKVEDIELNNNCIIFLTKTDGQYKVSTITYLPEQNLTIPIPPVATGTSNKK